MAIGLPFVLVAPLHADGGRFDVAQRLMAATGTCRKQS